MKSKRSVEYPAHFFLEVRLPNGNWALTSRDNDRPVMDIRFDYTVEHLKPGQAVRLVTADGTSLRFQEAHE